MPSITELAAQIGLEATTSINKDDDAVVDYFRGNVEVSDIDAVKAGKTSRVFTQERMGMVSRPDDWIVKRSWLEAGELFPPDEGDYLRVTKGSRITLYRVCRLPDEDACWREHLGAGGEYVRIHSVLDSEG